MYPHSDLVRGRGSGKRRFSLVWVALKPPGTFWRYAGVERRPGSASAKPRFWHTFGTDIADVADVADDADVTDRRCRCCRCPSSGPPVSPRGPCVARGQPRRQAGRQTKSPRENPPFRLSKRPTQCPAGCPPIGGHPAGHSVGHCVGRRAPGLLGRPGQRPPLSPPVARGSSCRPESPRVPRVAPCRPCRALSPRVARVAPPETLSIFLSTCKWTEMRTEFSGASWTSTE